MPLKPLLLSSTNLSLEITFRIILKIRLFFSNTEDNDFPAIFLLSGSGSDNRFKISASLNSFSLNGKRRDAEVSSKSLTHADLPVADFSISISSTKGSKRYGFLFLKTLRYGSHLLEFVSLIQSFIILSSTLDNSNVKNIKEDSISVNSSDTEELYLEISASSMFVAKIRLLWVPIL